MSLVFPSIERALFSAGPQSYPLAALLPVALALAAAFLAINLALPRVLTGGWNIYAAQPVLWLALGFWCRRRSRRATPRADAVYLGLAAAAFHLGVAAAAFHLGALAVAGLLFGFGHSPLARTPPAVAGNLVFLASMVWGMEAVRSYAVGRLPLPATGALIAVAFCFGLFDLAWSQLAGIFSGGRASIVLTAEFALPAFASSLLATQLSLLGGARSAFAYRFLLLAGLWLSPILPSLPWLVAAAVGTLVPAFILTLVATVDNREPAAGRQVKALRSRSGALTWGLLVLAVGAGLLFSSGALGVQPSIVSGASMEPNLRLGDIVITREVSPADIAAGDVIRFRDGEIDVVHRVVEVRSESSGLVFLTRGDSNNFLDPPVPASAVKGKVILVVPKLGVLPVTVKSLLSR